MRRRSVKVLTGTIYATTIWSLDTSATGATPVVVGDDAQTWTLDTPLKVTTYTSNAAPTPTGSFRENELFVTALAVGAVVGAPTGTPVEGNKLLMRLKDNGTTRAVTFNAIYQSSGVATLPATLNTVAGKYHALFFRYNATLAKWVLMAIDTAGYS
jgi:hypothetical protein